MEKNEFLAVTQQFMSQQGFQLLKKASSIMKPLNLF